MQHNLIFLPLLLQMLIPIVLYLVLGVAKSRAVKNGEVNEERRALHADAWPEAVQKINNSIRNQFEAPVLFYVLIVILWNLHAISNFVHALAWMFVASRVAHASVHVGSNYVPLRRNLFSLGVFILLVLSLCAFTATLSA